MSGENSEMGSAHIKTAGNLVAAYVSNNHIAPSDLPELIASVHTAISALATGGSLSAGNAEHDPEKPTSAKVRKSVRPDALISFIDGKPYSTLKRHLAKHGFNPDSYRAQYGLPADYPMVSPSYSEKRSAMARNIGFGTRTGRNAKAEPPQPVQKGRKKKVA